MKDRITFLDGHRGLAILLVIGYHVFARWTARIPNGDCCADMALFKFGWLGVELFFVLSGFVILMTLERCATATAFLSRRWLRLFPAMLVCSLAIYASAPLFPDRPAGVPGAESLLPGWFFMDLAWSTKLFGHPIKPLEGSFWSLYVEAKFYVVAALVYYRYGREALVRVLLGTASVAFAVKLLMLASGSRLLFVLSRAGDDFGLDNWFWFASGAAFFVYYQTRRAAWMRLALVAMLGGAAWLGITAGWPARGFDAAVFAAGACVGVGFALSLVSGPVQAFLNGRLLQFFGFVSYPLYLLHENMLVASLVRWSPSFPRWCFPLAVLALLAPLALAAFLVARYLEPALRRKLAALGARVGAYRSSPGGSLTQERETR